MGRFYDKPVRNLISELNKTEHVTHTSHRKDMVTLHHNAGRLSHDGVLNVWKTRPASAHLNVDAAATVAQYVLLNEYAWACGNAEGNRRSMSIEMANSTLGPEWRVGEATWREAARLAGFLFAEVVGARPTSGNLVMHSRWKSTLCAGPYIGGIMTQILEVANQSYDYFRTPPPPPAVAPKSLLWIAREVLSGKWGNGEDRKSRLNAAGYDYNIVQAKVNELLGAGAPAAHKKTVDEVAHEVIQGLWGNGAIRRQRLGGAGYNYDAVQRRVNELI